jgi:hypothetical protein
MLASLGFLVQEGFHPLFGGEIGGSALDQLAQVPVPWVVTVTLAVGIAEASRIQAGFKNGDNALKATYSPGDLGFDPLGIRPTDPQELRTMQERELSHGRLAMIASTIFIGQETFFQKPWGEVFGGSGLNLANYF